MHDFVFMILALLRHHLEFMSTISLNFGVLTRNWPRIDFQPLEFNFERDFGWGGGRFAEFQHKVKIVGLYIKLKTCSRSQQIIQNNYFD